MGVLREKEICPQFERVLGKMCQAEREKKEKKTVMGKCEDPARKGEGS